MKDDIINIVGDIVQDLIEFLGRKAMFIFSLIFAIIILIIIL
ncbi:MAG: hypothetical protein WC679_13595 [Bacteroidales bacterium]|jgi:hypothetical protein